MCIVIINRIKRVFACQEAPVLMYEFKRPVYLDSLAKSGIWVDANTVQGMARMLGRDVLKVTSLDKDKDKDKFYLSQQQKNVDKLY